MINSIGKVEFLDPQDNQHRFWITYDPDAVGNWFEVWQELGKEDYETLGTVNRLSTAFELIALHTRVIIDEDNFLDELGIDSDDWEGLKKKLRSIAIGAEPDPLD